MLNVTITSLLPMSTQILLNYLDIVAIYIIVVRNIAQHNKVSFSMLMTAVQATGKGAIIKFTTRQKKDYFISDNAPKH